MKQLTKTEQFEKVLKDNPLVLTYFSGAGCSVCKSLKPKIEMLVEQQFPSVKFFEIKTEENPALSASLSIFAVPVVILFVDGKDYIREARNISTTDLANKMDKIVKLYEE